ncbi:MAG: LptF/LptG family permease [Thermoguttaceae bacterium]
MFIIDRYLLRQFMQTFVICFLCMTGLFVVFDAFTNLECFLHAADKHGGLARLLAGHYAFQSLWFFDKTAGLLTLTAAMFTAAWIQRHQELTALMAAGISRVRVVAPVVGAVVVIVLLASLNRELVMPCFQNELARKPQDYAGDTAQKVNSQWDGPSDIFISGSCCYAERQRIEKPSFHLPAALDHFAKQITAAEAFYHPPENGRPAGYLLAGVSLPKNLTSVPSLMLRGRPLVITPHDEPLWLKPDQCFVVSEVTFDDLSNGQASRAFASTRQLISYLRTSPDSAGILRVTIHSRIVQPILDVTLLFLGLPLIVKQGNRNVFAALGLCGVIVAVFSLVVLGLQYLGSTYAISPTLAVWAPLMVFVPAAVEMGATMAE